jgi:hypothetical protein
VGHLFSDNDVVTVIRRIAYLVSIDPFHEDLTVATIDRISGLVLDDARRWLTGDERAELWKAVTLHLPIPVLTVTGADGKETAWTQYLAHMLDRDERHGLGERLGKALFRYLVGPKATSKIFVLSEVDLGVPCQRCGHACRLDLMLIGLRHVVVIEQKIHATKGRWKCGTDTHHQLEEYSKVVPSWVDAHHGKYFPGANTPKVIYRFLTPTGREAGNDGPDDLWKALRHEQIAAALLPELRAIDDPIQRYMLASFLLDLHGPSLGSWMEALEEITEILRPSEIGRTKILRLYRLKMQYQTLFELLEVIK